MSDAREDRVQAAFGTLATAHRARAELQRRSLKHFIKNGWQQVEPGVEYLHNWHVDAISEHLTALARRQIRRLIINMPPRCAKSSLGSVLFPAWLWLDDPTFKMITTSYERALAVRDSNKARRLIETPWYKSLNVKDDETGAPIFRMRERGDRRLWRLKDSEDYYENNMGGTRISVGVDGGATGKGGDMIAVDDPQNPQQAHSDAMRIQALTWWDQTMSTRLDNQRTGLKLIIMQRLHTFDLTGHELAKDVGYVHLKLPMEFNPEKRCVTVLGLDKDGKEQVWSDPRSTNKEVLHPARFDDVAIADLKQSLGPYGWAGQEQQEPIPEGGGTFKIENFGFYDALPLFDVIAMSVDCAFTDAEASSYVVIQVWGFAGPNAYLLDNVREHLSFVATEAMIHAVRAKFTKMRLTPHATLIENKANGPAVISRLVTEFPGIIPCEPRKMGGSKIARASSVSPFVQSGNVLLPRAAPWLADFFLEVQNFPKYTSDDQVDAMTQVLWWRFLSNVDIKNYARKERFLKWAGVKI